MPRVYRKVKINYNGWVTTPKHARYDQLHGLFDEMANLVIDDDERTHNLTELLQNELKDLNISIPITSCGSNPLSQGNVQIAFDCPEGTRTSSGPILDPHCTITKGAPRKLRKKGILETRSKKSKVCLRLYFRYLLCTCTIKCSYIMAKTSFCLGAFE